MARLLNKAKFLKLFGVPQQQLNLIESEQPITKYVFKQLKNVFTKVEISNNYFWQLYFYGEYKDVYPEYLKEENFDIIKSRLKRIDIKYDQLINHIDSRITHLQLLDHMDWHLHSNPDYINALWSKIFPSKQKILFRSAASKFNFISDYEIIETGSMDRVGTYKSTVITGSLR